MKRNTKAEADRLNLSPKTLENWRSIGVGPPFLKLGARVVYDEIEVDKWLAKQQRTSTTAKAA
jgi:predicted DNA-binding transcriptional regulator AlpA